MRQTIGLIFFLVLMIPLAILFGGIAVLYLNNHQGEPPINAAWLIIKYGSNADQSKLLYYSLCIYGFLALAILAGFIRYLIRQSRMVYGSAKLADFFDVRKTGLLKEQQGLFFGYYNGRPLFDNSQLHVLLIAESGTGKGVSLIIPNLFLWSGSVICTDMKKENFDTTSGYRAARGQSVFLFDPFSANTHRINPLAYLDDNNPIDHFQRIAYAIWQDKDKSEKIWSASARNLFVGLSLLIYLEKGKNALTFANILSLQSAIDYKTLDERLKQVKGRQSLIDACWQLLSQHANTPDKTRGGFEAEFRAALDIFVNPLVAYATSGNDVPLDRLRKDPITLYLNVVPANISRVSFLMRLIMDTVNLLHTQEEFKANPEHKYPLLLLNDEQHNFFGSMELIMKAASFYRSYGIRLFSVYQSSAQIKIDYGNDGAQAYIDNHSIRLFYAPSDHKKAKAFAEEIGETTIFTKSVSKGQGSKNHSEAPQKREAYLPDELMKMLKDEYGLLFMARSRPIKFKKALWYKEKTFYTRKQPPIDLPSVSTQDIETFLINTKGEDGSFEKQAALTLQARDPVKALADMAKAGASEESLNSMIDNILLTGKI